MRRLRRSRRPRTPIVPKKGGGSPSMGGPPPVLVCSWLFQPMNPSCLAIVIVSQYDRIELILPSSKSIRKAPWVW